MATDWTDRQKMALNTDNKNLLVSAAAGSGKTSVLVERVIRLMEQGTPLSGMLVITFTNAAAAEMKERIASRVGYGAVSRSNICTFDKFAIEIYRKYYHVIGVKPGLSVCDEYRASLLSAEALDELFQQKLKSKDPDFRSFLNCYCDARSNDDAGKIILEFHRFLQSLPDPEGWLSAAESGELFDIEKFIAAARSFALENLNQALGYIRKAHSLLSDPGAFGFDCNAMPVLAGKLAEDIASIESIAWGINGAGYTGAFKVLSDLGFVTLRASKAEKPDYESVKETVKALRDSAKKLINSVKSGFSQLCPEKLETEKKLLSGPLSTLCRLTGEYGRIFSEKKLEAGLMDFSDSAHFALKILENPDVCSEYREAFRYIFVDEYQDSNRVQEALIQRIARENNLFMVGDVKQSIYKFRLAEPEIFLEKYGEFKSGSDENSAVVDLNENFRSRACVIEFINRVFSSIMTRASAGMDYDSDAALKEGKPHPGAPSFRPKLWLVASSAAEDEEIDEQIAELKAAELEARNAANIISEYVGKKIFTKDGEPGRPLDYRDMVILLRSVKNKGEIYYQALTERGIPVYIERGEGYFDTPEIQAFLNLIRIVDNFRHDIPLISVMHCPAFGFSAGELAEIRIFSPGDRDVKYSFSQAVERYAAAYGDYLSVEATGADLSYEGSSEDSHSAGVSPDKSAVNPVLGEKVSSFLSRLSDWRTAGRNLPLGDFVWKLLIDSGILSFACALRGGDQRGANLRAMVSRAEEYESRTAGGLSGFVSYMDILSGSTGVSTGQVGMVSEADNVVRIMTIHKSKGLEFPFVLLAGLGDAFRWGSGLGKAAFHKDLGVSLRLSSYPSGVYTKPMSLELINLERKKEDLAEIIRVLYVAMTRAKDILLLSGTVKDPEKFIRTIGLQDPVLGGNYLSMVAGFMPSEDIKTVSLSEHTGLARRESRSSEKIEEAFEKGFDLTGLDFKIPEEELKRRFEYSLPEPEDAVKKKYSVSELAAAARLAAQASDTEEFALPAASWDMSGPGFAVPVFAGGKKSLNGAQKGTAYHSVMEHISFTPEGKSPEEIGKFILELQGRGILTADEASAVDPEKIAEFFRSDIAARAMKSSGLHRETPFVLRKEMEGRNALIQGTIDCWFEEPDGVVLLDYKSNYVDREHLEESLKHLKESYFPQLQLYREALGEILGLNVREGYLYLFGTGTLVEI